MSPEQASGKQRPAGPASDVYSLGAVLYATLTGRAPFVADSPVETLLQVVNREPLPPRSLNPGIPRDLETICLKCLAKQPNARYATAQELADDLQRWLDDRPIRAKAAGPVKRTWKWMRRHPAWTAFLLVLVVASVTSTWLWRRAEHAYGVAAEQLYVNRLALAEREWHVQNRSRAMELLLECDPQRRGWEWQFVARLCFATPHVDLPVASRLMGMVQFDPTGRFLATADQASLRIWNARGLRRLCEIEGAFFRFAFSPDGEQIAAGIENEVHLYASQSGQLLGRLYAGEAKIYSVAFDSRGDHLALLDATFTVVLIRVADQTEISRFSVHDVGTARWGVWLRFVPDSQQIVVGVSDATASLWDPFRGEKIEDLTVSETRGRPCALSADGTRIAYNDSMSGSNRKQVYVHDVRSRQIFEFPLDYDAYAVAFSPDGQTLAIALDEYRLYWEDLQGAKNDITGFLGAMVALGMTAQQRRAMIYLVDIETGKRRRQLRGHAGHVFFDSLAFSPDGKQLVSAGGFRRNVGEDDFVGELKVWDLDDSSPALVLRGHDAAVKHVAVSADSKWIASGDTNGAVCIWDVNGQLQRVLVPGTVLYVASRLPISAAVWSSPTTPGWSGGTSRPAKSP
jgi:eukaryotic-like serine/threonine-protein kinase